MENTHYYSENNDKLPSNPKVITAKCFDRTFKFTTDNGVFSKDYLDHASLILLKNLYLGDEGDVLDVGCGYGPIGIILSILYNRKITMIDINSRALNLALKNTEMNDANCEVISSDCLTSVLNRKFNTIISNPPIRAGKEVIYKIFTQSYEVLQKNGLLWIVIQHHHGAPSAIKKLDSIFGNHEIVYKKKGFYVIKCTKLS